MLSTYPSGKIESASFNKASTYQGWSIQPSDVVHFKPNGDFLWKDHWTIAAAIGSIEGGFKVIARVVPST